MTLLAKSLYRDGRQKTILDHTTEVMAAAEQLFGSKSGPTRLGKSWLQFFNLPDDYYPEFYNNLMISAAFHDLGKANDGFQNTVRHKGQQVIRHEHLSGLIMCTKEVKSAISQCQGVDFELILGAVISHHTNINHSSWAKPKSLQSSLKFFHDEQDVKDIFKIVGSFIDIDSFEPKIPPIWNFQNRGSSFCQLPLLEEAQALVHRANRKIRRDIKLRSFLLSLKAGLIAADSCASGVIREGFGIKDWLEHAFDKALAEDYIDNEVLQLRIHQIEKQHNISFRYHDFQDGAAQLGSRGLLLASCGAGKTLAAWRWASEQLKKNKKGRVIFLYPTRGTATEGFKDYISWAPETDAALVHGTSSFELEGLFTNGDERSERDYTTNGRLFALGLWHRNLFSATVDQFLSFLQHQYSSLCLLPVLADSILIIDEVHSFDNRMFTALVEFLENFQIPVLCMTATLPKQRRQKLEEAGLEPYPSPASKSLKDIQLRSEHPRLEVKLKDKTEVEASVQQALSEGRKVLWVVNQVARCQEIANKYREQNRAEVICYHSRFRLMDRRERHREVVDAFQNKVGTVLAVTTQVCEMSLDLDADLLVSELAPISSLIQRMGRCNRNGRPGDGKRGTVILYEADNELPYEAEEIEAGKKFSQEISGRVVSLSDLEKVMKKHQNKANPPPEFVQLMKSGLYALKREFRDIDNFTISAVLDSDKAEYLGRRKTNKDTAGFIVPVPAKYGKTDPQLGKFLAVAESVHYSEKTGFSNSPIQEEIFDE